MPDLAPHHTTTAHTTTAHTKRVLIVDPSADSRDVIRTVLERRGVEIYEARTARAGLEILRRQRPDVIVFDLETEAADDVLVRAQYDDELSGTQAEMVILGNMRRDQLPPDRHLMRKPYHYGMLIQKIEELVRQLPATLAQSAAT